MLRLAVLTCVLLLSHGQVPETDVITCDLKDCNYMCVCQKLVLTTDFVRFTANPRPDYNYFRTRHPLSLSKHRARTPHPRAATYCSNAHMRAHTHILFDPHVP